MNLRHVFAIAGLTLRDAIRSRLLPALAILLAVVTVAVPMLVTESASGTGRLWLIARYTMAVFTFILNTATLWASCVSVAGEITDRRIHLVLAKPVRKREIWLGKWLGIVGMNAALLAFGGLLMTSLLHLTYSRLAPGSQAREEAAARLLTARVAVSPETPGAIPLAPPNLPDRVVPPASTPEPVRSRHGHPDNQQQIRSMMTVPPHGILRLCFRDIPARAAPQPSEFRFAVESSRPDSGFFTGLWTFSNGSGQTFTVAVTNRPGAMVRLSVPAFATNGSPVVATFARTDASPAHLLLAPRGSAPQLLIPTDTLGPNLTRTLCVSLFRLAFVAAIGVSLSCILSLPVSVFAGFAVLVILNMTGFIATVAATGTFFVPHDGVAAPPGFADEAILRVISLLSTLTRPLDTLDPQPLLADGQVVPWAMVAKAWLVLGILYPLIVGAAGVAIFRRRELP